MDSVESYTTKEEVRERKKQRRKNRQASIANELEAEARAEREEELLIASLSNQSRPIPIPGADRKPSPPMPGSSFVPGSLPVEKRGGLTEVLSRLNSSGSTSASSEVSEDDFTEMMWDLNLFPSTGWLTPEPATSPSLSQNTSAAPAAPQNLRPTRTTSRRLSDPSRTDELKLEFSQKLERIRHTMKRLKKSQKLLGEIFRTVSMARMWQLVMHHNGEPLYPTVEDFFRRTFRSAAEHPLVRRYDRATGDTKFLQQAFEYAVTLLKIRGLVVDTAAMQLLA